VPDQAPIRVEHLTSLAFCDDKFIYKDKPYSFDEVAHVKFVAVRTQHSVNFIPTGTTYETDLQLFLANGQVLRIIPDRGFRHKEARFEAVLRAAEILSEITFTNRMEHYEAELARQKFLTWDGRQFAPNGDLFQSHEFKFNLRDKNVDARMGVFHLQCRHKRSGAAAALRSFFFDDDQIVDISTDRDCFLYFMKHHVGLSWSNERIRSKRRKSKEIYFDALLRLGAKICKIDGTVSAAELLAFKSHFGIDENVYPNASRVFREAIASKQDAKSLAREVYAIFDGAQQPLEYVLLGLLKIAAADGVIHDAERKLILDVGAEFHLTKSLHRLFSLFEGIGGEDRESRGKRGSSSVRDWYLRTLGLNSDAVLDDIKKAYRDLARLHHPDVLRAQGVPIDQIKDAEQVLKTINSAYEWLLRDFGVARGMN
jgi:DnaJ like chaperone protein